MIALVALALGQGFAAGFEGVWITQSGVPITILSSDIGQAMIKDRYYSFFKLKQTPDGSILGVYVASNDVIQDHTEDNDPKRFTVATRRPKDEQHILFDMEYSQIVAAASQPYVPKPSKQSDLGEIACVWAAPDAYGRYTSFKVSVYDQKQTPKEQGLAIYSLPLSGISVSGKWTDNNKISCDLTDDGLAIHGSLTEDGIKYILEGTRAGERGTFYLANASTGRCVGYGAIEWAPTPDRALRIRVKDEKQTDRILLNYTSPVMQSGKRIYLSAPI